MEFKESVMGQEPNPCSKCMEIGCSCENATDSQHSTESPMPEAQALSLSPGAVADRETSPLILRRYIVYLSILGIIAFLGVVYNRVHFLWRSTPGGVQLADFVLFYMCGSIASSPLHDHIYDAATQLSWQNNLIAPLHLKEVFYCPYVPFLIPFLIPLAWLPIAVSYWVWNFITTIVGWLGLRRLLRTSALGQSRLKAAILLGTLVSYPAMESIYLGQLSLLYLAIVAVYCEAILSNRRILSGLALALMAVKVQYVVPLGLPLLLENRWSSIRSSILSIVCLCLLSCPIVGWTNVLHYPLTVIQAGTLSSFRSEAIWMVSLRGLFCLLMGDTLGYPLSGLSAVLVVIIIAGIWLKRRKIPVICWHWRLALLVIVALSISPHTFVHDYVLMAIPAALTLPSLQGTCKARSAGWLWQRLFALYPFVSWLQLVWPLDQVPAIYTAFMLAINATLIGAGWRLLIESEERDHVPPIGN